MLINILAKKSPLTFEEYMELSLYHPKYGYYARGSLPGKKGDYITSPCVHKIFGASLARQIIEIYEILKDKKDFLIVEAGAGQGFLARDILEYSEKKGYNFNYLIIEPFPSIRKIQEETLNNFKKKIIWVESLEKLPEFRGVFLSNELFDSFPVKLIEKKEGKVYEVWIKVKSNGVIREILKDIEDKKIFEIIEPYHPFWKEGYRTEVCLRIEKFYKILSEKMKEGFIITIDYGFPRQDYYSPERFRGTLLCYYEHKVIENPYFKPGETDITSHVDFTLLRELGEKHGFLNLGFTQQGSFLVALGINEVFFEISERTWKDKEALKFLIFPEGLGTSHWVLVQAKLKKKLEENLRGFSLNNRIYLLYK
ncbi:MAG: SAM-dependent methyltransferase [Thermodesulfobacterium geofontis]|uniref:SAM-dependent methyltransferase n=1 Tax=Thermodesulfobacterium geofontis TaxID=1295609 RepID=A0A2N7Q8R4_9BACT|nr:MAG: SAM-dependent methyltransferase [Thermodesulfobacterium geofontis]